MNQRQKDFILNKLCPFILREEGRGFNMDYWMHNIWQTKIYYKGKEYLPPKCNTICCIGGSIDILLPKTNKYKSEILGLSDEECNGLFYNYDSYNDYGWPDSYIKKLESAKTPYGAARVAVALLKKVVETEGKILHRQD